MVELQDWQQRVVDEQAQLHERITKLQAFIASESYGQLCCADRLLLAWQCQLMCNLDDVLLQRIERFSSTCESPRIAATDASS